MISRILGLLRSRNFAALSEFPFIGRIFSGIHKRPHIPSSVRRRVLSAGRCKMCESTSALVIDHIIPFSKGGAHEEHNFQCLCSDCNRKKGDKLT